MLQSALLLMVKNPIAGKTKTRLAAEVGDDMALSMYGRLLSHTREQAQGIRGLTRYLYYSDHVDEEDDWPADDFVKLVQRGQDLGQRMQQAFDHAFARGHKRAVIIGSDCPGLNTELLQRAFDALDRYDLVLGPARDGGYYLLGLRSSQPRLFQDMEWSTASVAQETLARAQVQGLSQVKLEELSDVDYLQDWLDYGWPLPR